MTDTTQRLLTAALAVGLLAPAAGAKSADKKTTWGAAAAAAGVGAVVEATKDHPVNAAVLAAGAIYAYNQYDKARHDDRFSDYPVRDDGNYRNDRGSRNSGYNNDGYYDENDPYGYGQNGSDRPSWRPGETRGRTDRYGYDDNSRYPTARYTSRTREVTGVVTGTPNAWDRSVKVRLDNGEERTISVPKDIPVRRQGRAVSIHDLDKNEVVRIQIQRYSNSGDLRARRIDITGIDNGYRNDNYRDNTYNRDNGYYRDDPYGRNDSYGNSGSDVRLSGTVSSIDSRAGIVRVDVDGRILTVYTDNADIRDSRGVLGLRDLDNGDRVTVEGRRDGNRVDATRLLVR